MSRATSVKLFVFMTKTVTKKFLTSAIEVMRPPSHGIRRTCLCVARCNVTVTCRSWKNVTHCACVHGGPKTMSETCLPRYYGGVHPVHDPQGSLRTTKHPQNGPKSGLEQEQRVAPASW